MEGNQLHPQFKKNQQISLITLFASSGTLICCALPALLVGLGAGAVMASIVSNLPQMVWFSEHKLAVFVFAGLMLLVSGAMQWRARLLPCPSDITLAALCLKTRKKAFRIYACSVAIYLIGGFFAFIAPSLFL